MQSRPAKRFNIVTSNLKKTAASDPSKTMAEVLLDGSYTNEDLNGVMNSLCFPSNANGDNSPNEPRYTSNEAISQFAEVIEKFLTDAELHRLTSLAIQREVLNDQEAFRNATLAKALLRIEMSRHQQHFQPGKLQDVIACHMKEYIYPLIKQHWGKGKITENVIKFLEFNLGIKGLVNVIDQIEEFDSDAFNKSSDQLLAGSAPDSEGKMKFILHNCKDVTRYKINIPDRSFLPQLPTPQYAREHVDEIYSDHLPILTILPVVSADPTLPSVDVSVISWNVWDMRLPCGFKSPNNSEVLKIDHDKRYERIMQTLSTFADSTNEDIRPDVIALQEVNPDFFDKLKTLALNVGFSIVGGKDGLATLYRTDKLKLVADPVTSQAGDTLTTHFSMGDRNISVTNVHIPHSDIPDQTEAKLAKLMTGKHASHMVVGDFNCRVGSFEKKNKLLITGVCPSTFRRDSHGKEIGQGVDFTDGAFYLSDKGTIKQMETRLLDPATCEILDNTYENLDQYSSDTWNDLQLNELLEPRMVMCCASPNNVDPVFSGDKDVFLYQDKLRQLTSDKSITVRLGLNAINQKSVCLATTNRDFINGVISNLSGIRLSVKTFEFSSPPMYMVSVPREYAPHLECAVLAQLGLEKVLLKDALTSMLPNSRSFTSLFKAKPNSEKIVEIILDAVEKSQDGSTANIIIYALLLSENNNIIDKISNRLGYRDEMLKAIYSNRLIKEENASQMIAQSRELADGIFKQDIKKVETVLSNMTHTSPVLSK